MLIRFRVSNFRSLRDEQELSLVASLRDGRDDLVRAESAGIDLLRCAAIYGPNASGKSNVLLAMDFLRQAVLGSHRAWRPEGPVPRDPFLLDAAGRSRPTDFEVDFLVEAVRYRYGFSLDDEQVRGEWLYAYSPRRRLLFSRGPNQAFTFGKQFRGSNQTIAGLTRRNSLFLSAAAENNHPLLTGVHSWFATNLWVTSAGELANGFLGFPGSAQPLRLVARPRKEPTLELLRLADLGIVDVSPQEPDVERALQALAALRREGAGADDPRHPLKVMVHHQVGKERTFPLPLERESRGTLIWLSLLGPILAILDQGAVLCIDELDASLHPHLFREVVRIFQDPARNPRGAQLVLSTHHTALLGGLLGPPVFHRDQIWFTEKDAEGATHLYPLTDFKPRKAENLERGYLQGRYGAIPFIDGSSTGTDG